MNEHQELSGNFDSIKDYPENLLLYVDKYVKVQLIKKTTFSGFLHSIDPITLSVILSIPYQGNYQNIIIPGHAILDIQEGKPSTDIAPPQRKRTTITMESDLMERKRQLTAWFKKNLLPVTESDSNLKIGNVSMLSPYSAADICAENPVVALQIRKIMEAMPQDFTH